MNLALSYALLVAGAVLYAVSAGLFFGEAAANRGSARTSTPERADITPSVAKVWAPRLLTAGGVSHFGYICAASFLTHTCPVGSIHFVLSLVAIVCAMVFSLARLGKKHDGPRENLDALGMLVSPLGLAFLLGTFFIDKPEMGRSLGAGFLAFHVIMNVVGIALFTLAGAAATLYLVQERRLKQKKLARVSGLPPLDTLDRAVHRFLLLGFPLVTVGIVSGTFWAYQLESGSADEVMRIVFGYATWLFIGAVLVLRTAAGWRGKRSAYGTLLGLACAMCVLVIYMFRPTPQPTTSTHGQRSAGEQLEPEHHT